jgi:hypothetical protein
MNNWAYSMIFGIFVNWDEQTLFSQRSKRRRQNPEAALRPRLTLDTFTRRQRSFGNIPQIRS